MTLASLWREARDAWLDAREEAEASVGASLIAGIDRVSIERQARRVGMRCQIYRRPQSVDNGKVLLRQLEYAVITKGVRQVARQLRAAGLRVLLKRVIGG